MKTIVITGCTSGLGAAMCQYFIAEGYQVAGIGRNEKKIKDLTAKYANHVFSVCDVRSKVDLKKFQKKVCKQFGVPDLLINNASIINENNSLWEIPAQDVDELIDINIKGVINSIRAFLPVMIEQGKGVVASFSSYWGQSVSADVAPYCASKWAIEGLARALAEELPSGMASVAFNPGIINTPMLNKTFGSSAKNYPTAEEWVEYAGPKLLGLSGKDNGKTVVA